MAVGGSGTSVAYSSDRGKMFVGRAQDLLASSEFEEYEGAIQMIFTSPPFPLNRKKKYGNETGSAYTKWLADFAPAFRRYLNPTGSVVIELGNAWEPGLPVMSTLAMETLLRFREAGDFYLCQQFVAFNKARLPSPAQWVNVERIRVKDAFTHIWWMSPSPRPKADNRQVLKEYSQAMKDLLDSKAYNPGKRPSEHHIGKTSFLTDNQGAIPPNVLEVSNTRSTDPYMEYCKAHNIPLHPARMPRRIPEFFIKFLTDEEDLVLDPFAGSNVTGVVAEDLNRRWLAIEEDPQYARSSAARFSSLDAEIPSLDSYDSASSN